MSISSAFNLASSGLRVTESRANMVAGNIANASSHGYARREGVQISNGLAEGGTINLRVARQIDERLAGMSRGASADVGRAAVTGDVLRGYLVTLGEPGDAVSPAARMAEFQAGLDLLANNPSSVAVQADVLARADSLVGSLNDAATALTASRTLAADGLDRSATEVNLALSDLAKLNGQLRGLGTDGQGAADTMDEINRRLDTLGSQLDFQARWEANGTLTLHTTGGTELLSGNDAATLTVDRQSGAIFADGTNITPDQAGTRGITSGRMAGLSDLLSTIIPQMQRQQDELAGNLIQGFEAVDASLTAGQAGLFTDGGAAFDPAARDGLAGRLAINTAVRPEAGGALWRLRDGIGAATPGDSGATTQVNAFIGAFDTARPLDAAVGLGASARLGDLAADMVGFQHNLRVSADETRTTAGIRLTTYEDGRSSIEGVNIDTELQKLMEIEQAYGANSQVLTSLSSMIDTLLASV